MRSVGFSPLFLPPPKVSATAPSSSPWCSLAAVGPRSFVWPPATATSRTASASYSYLGKGGKTGRRELPQPALDALTAALTAFGKDLGVMDPSDSLWPTRAAVDGRGLSSGTFYSRFRRYLKVAGLPPAGLHLLRHTAAKLRRDAGRVWKVSPGSSTTVPWRSLLPISADSRGKKTGDGAR